MMKFVNPFTAGRRISDLEVERNHYRYVYKLTCDANESHRETNGELHTEITLAADNFDEMLTAYAQQEQAVFFHMEERKGLLEVIADIEEELEDLEDECDEYADCVVTLVSENQILNERLVEGSAAYDTVVSAGEQMADSYENRLADLRKEIQVAEWAFESNQNSFNEQAAELEEARKQSARELDYSAHCTRVAKEERDDAQQDLAIAERELEEVRSLYTVAMTDTVEAQNFARYARVDIETAKRELEALKLANTQSLSWVRQAAEALDAYGITIEDTPVGPTVQIDRDAFVNRIALDNVSAT